MTLLRRAAILAVGSEMLTPSRVDTNSLLLTEALNALGIEVVFKSVIGDDRDELAAAFLFAVGRVDLVVCTGGLGPTDDDLTRDVAADVLGRALAEDDAITAKIRARFASRGLEMPDINRRQAMVPGGARVLDNSKGTAPGLWLEDGHRVVLLLPGPPRELQAMLASLVEGPLKERASGVAIIRRTVRITGRTESHTEEAVRPLYAAWSRAAVPVSATILASLGQIELHVSARADTAAAATGAAEAAARQVVDALGMDAYSSDGRNLEEVVGALLVERRLRIAVAESCTGGLVTSRLTDVPGSSRYVDLSVVAYANRMKTAFLDVPAVTLEEHGAVSEAVAVAMAHGIRARASADVGVGVTGIAGPDGGTSEKPVGTVAIAAVVSGVTQSRVFRFTGDRALVKWQASQAALDMVRRTLLAR